MVTWDNKHIKIFIGRISECNQGSLKMKKTHAEHVLKEGNFGAWVFKSSGPFHDFPNSSGQKFMPLSNPDSREVRLMRTGDRAVFWTTKNYVFANTIWAIGTLTSGVRSNRMKKQGEPKCDKTRGIYVDWQPIPIDFQEHTRVGNLELFMRFKGAAPLKTKSLSFLTSDQFALIHEVLAKAQELQRSYYTDDFLVPTTEVHDFFEMADGSPILRT